MVTTLPAAVEKDVAIKCVSPHEPIVDVDMGARAVPNKVALDSVTTGFESRVKRGLFLPNAKFATRVEANARAARLRGCGMGKKVCMCRNPQRGILN